MDSNEIDVSIQFDIINPVTNKRKPRYDKEKDIFLFPVNIKYRYYIEASKTDKDTGLITYYLLLSKIKFSNQCRLCEVNMYSMCKIHPRGEFKDYVVRECNERGNITVDKIDSNSDFDTWIVN